MGLLPISELKNGEKMDLPPLFRGCNIFLLRKLKNVADTRKKIFEK
jgi:hypothetical protein